MAFKNGINGFRSFKVQSKNMDHYDHKTMSLNLLKSRTFIKNGYKFIRYQGRFYFPVIKKLLSSSEPKVWRGEDASILLINNSEFNSVIETFKDDNEEKYFLGADFDFNKPSLSKSTQKTLADVFSMDKYIAFNHKKTYSMAELLENVIVPLRLKLELKLS